MMHSLKPIFILMLATIAISTHAQTVSQSFTCQPQDTIKSLFRLTNTGVIASAFSPDHHYVYVLESTVAISAVISPTSGMSAKGDKLVYKINLATGKKEGQIDLGRPAPHQPIDSSAAGAMAITGNGRFLYVANNQKWISVINTSTWKVVRRFAVTPISPKYMTLSPDGKVLYITSWPIPDYDFGLAAYATASGKRLWMVPGNAEFNFMNLMYWAHKKKLLSFVTSGNIDVPGGIRSINPKTGKVGKRIATGPYFGALIAGRGNTLFAVELTNDWTSSGEIESLDGKTGQILHRVSGLKGLYIHLLYDRAKNVLYASYTVGKKQNEYKARLSAFNGTRLKTLSSVTCNNVVQLSGRPMAISRRRGGIYVVGVYRLWFIKTDKRGGFESMKRR